MRLLLIIALILLSFNGCIFSKKRKDSVVSKPITISRDLSIKQKALIVGVGNYKDRAYDLEGIDLDVQKMENLFKSWGFDVEVLYNENSLNFEKKLTQYADELSSNDIFIFYYTGHGSSTVDKSGDEVDDDRDELIVLSDGTKNRYILDDEIDKYFQKIRARKLIIIDACNSATINREYNPNSDKKVKYIPAPAGVGDSARVDIPIQTLLPTTPIKSGDYIFFAACQDNERSFTSKNGSAFTNRFTQYLNLNKTAKRVHKETLDSLKGSFHPNLSSSKDELKDLPLKSFLKIKAQ